MATRDAETVAVLLIAHGSRQDAANDDLHELADRLAARGDFPIVEPCFLELAVPDIPTGGGRCVARGATRVLMIPYFLSAGVHLTRDLVAARDELRRRHPGIDVRLGSALGPHPLLDDLVSERIRQVAVEGGSDCDPPTEGGDCYVPIAGRNRALSSDPPWEPPNPR
jgi:sirohydrochlorin ferrochelatase